MPRRRCRRLIHPGSANSAPSGGFGGMNLAIGVHAFLQSATQGIAFLQTAIQENGVPRRIYKTTGVRAALWAAPELTGWRGGIPPYFSHQGETKDLRENGLHQGETKELGAF